MLSPHFLYPVHIFHTFRTNNP